MPPPATGTADYEARSMINRMMDRMDTHEVQCGERQTSIVAQLNSIGNRQWAVVGILLAGMAGIISMLVPSVLPHIGG